MHCIEQIATHSYQNLILALKHIHNGKKMINYSHATLSQIVVLLIIKSFYGEAKKKRQMLRGLGEMNYQP